MYGKDRAGLLSSVFRQRRGQHPLLMDAEHARSGMAAVVLHPAEERVELSGIMTQPRQLLRREPAAEEHREHLVFRAFPRKGQGGILACAVQGPDPARIEVAQRGKTGRRRVEEEFRQELGADDEARRVCRLAGGRRPQGLSWEHRRSGEENGLPGRL